MLSSIILELCSAFFLQLLQNSSAKALKRNFLLSPPLHCQLFLLLRSAKIISKFVLPSGVRKICPCILVYKEIQSILVFWLVFCSLIASIFSSWRASTSLGSGRSFQKSSSFSALAYCYSREIIYLKSMCLFSRLTMSALRNGQLCLQTKVDRRGQLGLNLNLFTEKPRLLSKFLNLDRSETLKISAKIQLTLFSLRSC